MSAPAAKALWSGRDGGKRSSRRDACRFCGREGAARLVDGIRLDGADLGLRLARDRERDDLAGQDVDHFAAALQAPFHSHVRSGAHSQAALGVDGRRHDHVGNPCLVLQEHEDDALRGSGPLASDHDSRDLQGAPVGQDGQVGVRHHAVQFVTE